MCVCVCLYMGCLHINRCESSVSDGTADGAGQGVSGIELKTGEGSSGGRGGCRSGSRSSSHCVVVSGRKKKKPIKETETETEMEKGGWRRKRGK